MGFFLSILYLAINNLGSNTVFGALAAYRPELIAAGLIGMVSIPTLMRSSILDMRQSLAVGGLWLAAFLSVLFGEHWLGGAVQAFTLFISMAFAYFLVTLYCNSRRRLQILILMLLFVCFFVIGNGYIESLNPPRINPVPGEEAKEVARAISTPYRVAMQSDSGEWFYRLRGQNEIHDPNDLAQFILCVIPLVFVFWRNGKKIRNTIFVLAPICILLFGIFLTHSRGALLALTAMMVFALRRRLGTIPSLAAAGGVFVLASFTHFTGGRDISAESGADRTALWGDGLELVKTHPVFGVGLQQMADVAGNTAHNTIVVCVAELGLFGMFFWSLFLISTVTDMLILSSPEKVCQENPQVPAGISPLGFQKEPEKWTQAELNRWGQLLALSMTGFLVSGFFLSRAFVSTFFMLGGMTEAVYQIALSRGMVARRLPMSRMLKYSAVLTVSFVVFMWFVTRFLNAVR